jgi:DNA-binding beta-propeller fold protein YncE
MILGLLQIGLLPLLAGCSSSEMIMSSKDDAGTMEMADNGEEPSASDEGEYDDGYEPEVEDDLLALMPATTPEYVFVANPDRNTVTRISVPGLAVITTEVGDNPISVAVTPDHSTAVTFNMNSNDISIIDAGTLEVQTVEVRDGRNEMVMSPDGAWVICYFNHFSEETGASTGGAQSFNDISLVNIDTLEHFPMVVGPNPRGVHFSADGAIAVVVSDSYLSRIDLTADEPEPEHIQITEDLIDPPTAEEVVLDPMGTTAIVRQFGATDLVHVDLELLARTPLPVGDNPTDLDITPDGTELVVVARGSSELWVYDLANPFDTQSVLDLPEETIFGSVLLSPDDERGLLYSTASGESLYASWDRSSGDVVLRDLVKPVKGMGISPTGGTAIISHGTSNGIDVDSSSPYYNRPAISLVDLDTFFGSSIALPAEPTQFANTPDGETGFFVMDGQPYLEVVNFNTLIHDEIELKSNPVHLGTLLDTDTAFISQEHHLGRISFFHPEDEELQTITGFELNANIEQ